MGKSTGVYTTEFWVSVLIVIAAFTLAFFNKVDGSEALAAIGAVGAGYAVSRGLAKKA